jgi:hypothetical protein
MRALSFNRNGPRSFILAVDCAFAALNPQNDQVWSVNLDRTHVYPLCLQTTYGLRARSMRIFPQIRINNKRCSDPHTYQSPPEVTHYSPDTLRVECSPLEQMDIRFDFFIPETDVLVGGIRINHSGDETIDLSVAMAAALVPMGEGIPTRSEHDGINHIILGQTRDIWPVLLLTGGPMAINNPCPALEVSHSVQPGHSLMLTWATAAKGTRTASLEAARAAVASGWMKTSQAHVMRHNSQTVQIKTSRADWDAAFALSQVVAMNHFVSRSEYIDHPFFLRTRLPDQPPYSPTERKQIDDLTILEATHLAQVLLPAQAELLVGVVENLLKRSDETGFLPSRLNPSSLIQPFCECPLLANLSLNLYERNNDRDFLIRVFPGLCRVTEYWLSAGKRTDEVEFHAWKDIRQLQLENGLFNFDTWKESGRGLALQSAESPALLAMLLRETKALSKIAEILEDDPRRKGFAEGAQSLKGDLDITWQDKWQRFAYLDGESRRNPEEELHVQGPIQEILRIEQVFKVPQRIQLHLISADEHTRVCTVEINGRDAQGKLISEQFRPRDFHWAQRRAHLTTQHIYASVDTLSIKGMKPEDEFLIETADYSESDISCLLPIWSGAADAKQIESMLMTHLNPEKASLSFGIPETWETSRELPSELPNHVNVLWNSLVIDGLLREGYIDEAAALFSNLMGSIVTGLYDFDGFYADYDSKTGKPAGKRNAIAGLTPLQLFLKIAGIQLLSATRVAVMDHNPFQDRIEVCWQGLLVRREGIHTRITFPDGCVYEGDPEEPICITSEGV